MYQFKLFILGLFTLRGRPIFSNHSDDFRPNWTPIAPFTITNRLFVRKEAKKRHLYDRVTLRILSGR